MDQQIHDIHEPDGIHEPDVEARGFPAFPPQRRGAKFARTWWGNAWIQAVEDTALDGRQLRASRAFAKSGRVGTITVSPGRIAAPADDVDGVYQSVVHIDRLTDDQWERFLDQVASKAGHIAALLDHDMPQELVDAAEDIGIALLPGIGDLEPSCDCESWDLPCKHAAALSYQVSWLLDADPFLLLMLRGRGERQLLEDLRQRQSAGPAVELTERPAQYGTPAREAYAAARTESPDEPAAHPELPTLAELPDFPEPPASSGLDPAGLHLLITDAAERARTLLTESDSAPAPLDLWSDTVRLWTAHPHPPAVRERLEAASGRPPKDLQRAAGAWQFGGPDALDVLDHAWTPTRTETARAATALASSWDDEQPPTPQIWRNRWTLTDQQIQLRLGRNGLWYPYRNQDGEWWPAAAPRRDPGSALTDLLAA